MSPLFYVFIKMESEAVKERVAKIIEQKLLEESEYFLVDIKLSGGNKLQVFLDADEGGITINKCAEFSRYLERFLDEEKFLGENYVLEVSSPGMNNPLKNLRQYKKRVGSDINVVKYDGQRIDGTLRYVDEDKIIVEQLVIQKRKTIGTKEHEIPFSEIKKTKLNFNF